MSSRPSRIPSPARSQGAVTPRRSRGRFSRSLGSPARSVASGRLSTIVSQFKNDNMNSFALSPVTGRSVLTDDTDIEEPRRKSWWKKLNDNSRDVIEALNTNQEPIMDNVVEELEVEILSQGKNNLTLDLPDSSGSESIGSIVLPQRKLFTQKENIPRNKDFGKIVSRRDSTAKLQKTQIELQENIGPKKLFGQIPQKSIFPSNLINTSVNKTAINIEPEVTSKKLFGANKVSKSKSIFPNDFINTSTNKTLIDENARAKNLFQRPVEKTKTVFPSALLTISPNKTIGNKTKELNNADVQVQARTLFGNRPGTKRKNMFADFIVAESEDEQPEMQDNLFPFPKRSDNVGRASRISYATDLEMDDWKVLPSSTMMEQLEEMITTQVQDPEDDKEESAEHEPDEVENSEVHKTRSVAQIGENDVINKSVSVDQNIPERMEEVPESGINEQEGATDNSRVEEEAVVSVAQQKDQGLVEHDKVEHMEVLKYVEESEVEEDSEVLEKEEEMNSSKVGQDENQKVGNADEEEIIETSKVQEIEVVEQEEVLADVDESEVQEEADSEAPEDVEESEVENEIDESEIQEESLVEEEIEESEAEQESEVQDDQEQSEAEQNNSEVSENELQVSDEQDDIEKEDDVEKGTVNKEEINNTKVGEKEKIEKEVNVTEEHKVHEQDVEKSEFREKEVLEPEPEQQEIEEVDDGMQKEDRGAEEDDVINNSEDRENDLQNEQEEVDAVQEESETEDQEGIDQMEEVQEEEENEQSVAEEEIQEQEEENEQSDEQEEMEQEDVQSDKQEEIDEENEQSDEQEEMEQENEESDKQEEMDEEIEHSDEQEEIEEENEQSDEEEIDNSDVHEEQVIESESEQEESQSEAQEVESGENEAEVDDVEQELDEDRNNEPNDKSEYPNVTHDTTGRYRKKKHNESKVKSPEAVLRDKTNNENNSFEMQPQGRNTSIRKTKSMMKMSLAPSIRESLGVDGSKNSSAEGSGWDSHRVTKKTIRQTFGKDFTPRKSLRALVMEKSAQRQTFGNEYINPDNIKVPQANSTEINSDVSIPNDDDVVNTTDESDHEVSRRTRQTTLEMYLQKVKKDTLERKQKMESAVRSSLKVPSKDVLNHYNISSKPLGVRKSKPAVPKANNKVKPSAVPLGILPMEVLKDMQYKPPKRFMPSNASWITKRLYKFLETKLEPKYDYKARVRAEKLVETIYNFTKYVRRHDVAPRDIIDELKVEMARLDVVHTHYDFYDFFHEFMPREIRIKVVPDIHNRLPIPKHGVFTPIIRETAVRG